MQNTDNVRPETPSLPKGGGAISGLKGDVASAGPDGANTLVIPLPINSGRGYAPSLALSYSSRSGNGPFGMGWSVDTPAIRRRTKKGTPNYDDQDEYVGPNGEVLVLSSGDTRTATSLLGVNLGNSFTVHRYRSRVESDFSRLEYWVSTGTGARDFWLYYNPDGQVLLFGSTAQARVSNPENPDNTAIWLLESSVSATGEQMYWLYRAEDNTGCETAETTAHPHATAQRYLTAVYYGNRVAGRTLPGLMTETAISEWLFLVVLDYGERSVDLMTTPAWVAPGSGDWLCRQDCFSSWEYGFEMRTRRLCRQVLGYHFTQALAGASESAPEQVSRLILTYNDSPAVTTLASIQQVGLEPDGTLTSLPPMVFGWNPFITKPETSWQEREDLANLNAWQPYQLVDLNGEGLAGVLYQDSGAWWYRAPVRKPGKDADAVIWDKPAPLPAIPALRDRGMLIDINGDGYMEWVVSSAGVNGVYARTPERGWLNFSPLSAFPVEYQHPRAQLADASGSGLADLVLIGPKSVRLYIGTGEGWEKARNVIQPDGVTLPVAGSDGNVLVAFSDMAGSGQQHLVEIKEDQVRYWPNKGHGEFGTPVVMSGWTAPGGIFNPQQLYLADIDGSGTTDVIYALSKKFLVYINQSGNSFSEPFEVLLPEGVRYDNTCDLQVADIQGLGIASLVLTVPHPEPRHYVCHLSSIKPWLLNQMRNNMGQRHNFTYRSSVQFWLDEKQDAAAAGEPVPASYLPFALHLLSRTDITDEITGNHLVSTARYRYGAWDGKEREFRGFGFVELQDTDTQESEGTTTEISQPSISRRWFSTGLPAIDDQLVANWWAGDSAAFAHFSPRFTSGYADNEQPYIPDDSEVFWLRRGTKGMLLRSELYGQDSSKQQIVPYQVSESRPQVRLVAAAAEGGYPIILPLTAETRTYTYERISNDPQCSQQVTLTSDQYGQPLFAFTLNYPRRAKPATSPYPDTLPETLFDSSYDDQQQQLVVTRQENHWYGIDDMASGRWVNGLVDAVRSDVYLYSSAPDTGLTLEDLTHSGAPLGTPASQAFAGWYQPWYLDGNDSPTSELPAFPPRIGFTETAVLDDEMVAELKEDLTDSVLQQAGYVWLSFLGAWVVHRNLTTYGTAEYFWLPQMVRDSELTGATILIRDVYNCVITKVIDAAGLTTQAEYDWRFLTPVKIIDVNNNIHQVTLDALGRVTSQRFSGTENGVAAGYSNAAFNQPAGAEEALALTAPLPVAQCQVYVTDSWRNGAGIPPHVVTLVTDRYDDSDEQQIRQSVLFSDGFGRELQTAVRFEAGEAWQRTDDGTLITDVVQTTTRWAVSGRTEYDNKGQAIRTYQPYFLNSWQWVVDDSAREDLYADTHFYDPVGRDIQVLTAKGYLRRTLYTPWFVASEDENDLTAFRLVWSIELVAVTNSAMADNSSSNSVRATVYDQYGVPMADQLVTFSADSDVTLEQASGNTDADGSVTAVLTSIVAGPHTLTVSCSGRSRTITVIFTADTEHLSPTLSTLAVVPKNIQAIGTDAATVTFILKDIHGNLAPGQSVSILSSVAGVTLSEMVDNGDGSYTCQLTSNVVGTTTLTVSVNGNIMDGIAFTVYMTPQRQAMPDTTIFNPNDYPFGPSDGFPNTGILGAQFQVLFEGSASNNSRYLWGSDQPWMSVDSTGTVEFIGTPDTTNNTGTIWAIPIDTGTPMYAYTFTLKKWFITAGSQKANYENAVIWCRERRLSIPAITDIDYPNLSERQRHAGRYLWSEWGDLSRNPGTGITSDYYCWVTDLDARGLHQNVALDSGGGSLDLTADAPYRTYYVVGKLQLVEEPVPSLVTFTLERDNAVADGQDVNYTKAIIYDQFGNLMRDQIVEYSSDDSVVFESASDVTNPDGKSIIAFRSKVAGAHTITITAGQISRSLTTTFVVDFAHLSPTLSTLTATPKSIQAIGTDAATVTFILKDIHGNPAPGQSVSIHSSVTDVALSEVVDNGDGSYTCKLTSNVLGTTTLTVSANGTVLDGITFVVNMTPIRQTMPNTTIFNPNDYPFFRPANGFPNTGILGAQFQVLFEGSASNNSLYQWGSDQPWMSVDSAGNVEFIGTPDTTNNTATISAIPIDTGTPMYAFTFTLKKWFITAGTLKTDWQSAVTWCEENGLQIPAVSDITYPGLANRYRKAGLYLWSEWGDLSRNPGTGVTSDYYCWVTDLDPRGLHLNVSLNSGGNKYDATPDAPYNTYYVVGLQYLAEPRVVSSIEFILEQDNVLSDGLAINYAKVFVHDQFGDLMPGIYVEYSSDESVIFDTTSDVTNLIGESIVAFSSEVAGRHTVTVSAGGVTSSLTTTFAVDLAHLSPTLSTLAIVPQTILANGIETAMINFSLRDIRGNLTPGQSVVFTNSLYGGGITISKVVDNGNGTYFAQLSSHISGNNKVSVTLNGAAFAVTPAVVTLVNTSNLGELSPALSTFSASTDTITANGTDTSTITLTLKDGDEVLRPGQYVDFICTMSGATLSSVVDNNDGTYVATLSSIVTGNAEVKVIVNGVDFALTPVTVKVSESVYPSAPSPTLSTLNVSNLTIKANGTDTTTITLTLKDEDGDLMTGQTVAFSSSLPGVTLSGNAVDKHNGTYVSQMSSTIAGQAEISAMVNGSDFAVHHIVVTIKVVPGAPDPASSTLTASPDIVIADDKDVSIITLTVKDKNGTPVPELAVTLSWGGYTGSVTDRGDGTYTRALKSDVAGSVQVGVGISGIDFYIEPVTVVFEEVLPSGTPSPRLSSLTVSPDTIPANGADEATITLTLKDQYGNPLTGRNVRYSWVLDGKTTIFVPLDNNDGIYVRNVSSTTSGTVQITAFLDGNILAIWPAILTITPE